MGLDITAFSNLKKIDAVFDRDGEPIDPKTRKPISGNYFRANSSDFDRGDGIEEGEIYLYKKRISLHAGSYGGYNDWREKLAKLAGYPPVPYERYGVTVQSCAASAWEATNGPFWELIYFSDCEGTIGPITSAKLARDFAEYQSKADAHEDELFRGKYNEWRKVFELAANNGAVSFH